MSKLVLAVLAAASLISTSFADEIHSNTLGAGLGFYHLNYQIDLSSRFSFGPSLIIGRTEVDQDVPFRFTSFSLRAEYDVIKASRWNVFIAGALGSLNARSRPEQAAKEAGAIGTTMLGFSSSFLLGARFYSAKDISLGFGLGLGVHATSEISAIDEDIAYCEEFEGGIYCEEESYQSDSVVPIPLLELSVGYRF